MSPTAMLNSRAFEDAMMTVSLPQQSRQRGHSLPSHDSKFTIAVRPHLIRMPLFPAILDGMMFAM